MYPVAVDECFDGIERGGTAIVACGIGVLPNATVWRQ
jgi:hypothetical protein